MDNIYVSENALRASGVLNVKQYGSKFKLTWNRSVRRKGYERIDGEKVSPQDEKDDLQDDIQEKLTQEKLSNNIARARSKVFEYAYCNEWDYFITLTIDGEKFGRYDLGAYIKALGKFINNYNTIYHTRVLYLFVPEYHKDKAWHMHGLISGIRPEHIVINKHGHLDFPKYANKFGYCNIGTIDSHEGVSKYITKYISKDLASRLFGQRLYYCSKGLKTAKLLYSFENVDSSFFEWDFEHEDGYCKTMMVDNLDCLANMTFI